MPHATPLTADQLADILFQMPRRITCTALVDRNPIEAWHDDTFAWPDRRTTHPTTPSAYERAHRKLCLYFSEECALPSEHPRSLLNAMRELKSLGFINAQLEEIAVCARRFILRYCEPDMPLRHLIKPGKTYQWNDKAFLGAAQVNVVKITSAASLSLMDDMLWNPSCNQNTLFARDAEEPAYDLFKPYLNRYVLGREDVFLAPQAPRSRYAKVIASGAASMAGARPQV